MYSTHIYLMHKTFGPQKIIVLYKAKTIISNYLSSFLHHKSLLWVIKIVCHHSNRLLVRLTHQIFNSMLHKPKNSGKCHGFTRLPADMAVRAVTTPQQT